MRGAEKLMNPTRFNKELTEEYLSKGYWDNLDSITIMKATVDKYPEKEALCDYRGKRLSWKQLDVISDKLALGFLRYGLNRGDRVLVQLSNVVENIYIRLALQKAGLIAVFAPLTLRGEMEEILRTLKPSAFISMTNRKNDYFSTVLKKEGQFNSSLKGIFSIDDEKLPRLDLIKDLIEDITDAEISSEDNIAFLNRNKVGPFEVPLVILTSGSTGTPKFCEWPEQSIKLYAKTVIQRIKLKSEDVIGHFVPFSGGVGMTLWFPAPVIGAKSVLLDKFDPETVLSLIEREGITVAGMVPTQIIRVAKHPNFKNYNLKTLRAIRVGGAALGYDTANQIEEQMGCKIVCAAGIADAMAIAHTHIDDQPEIRLCTVGKPWLHDEVRIVNDGGEDVLVGESGEIWVNGPCTASGYYQDIEATKKAWGTLGIEGWFRTGDLGRKDKEGNIKISGRKKNVIIRGGQNIYPEEVEAILCLHNKIIDAAIVSIPDNELGEKACACLVLREGEDLDLEELVTFLNQINIAKYKFPEKLVIFNEFPTLSEGSKVDRNMLTKTIHQKLGFS